MFANHASASDKNIYGLHEYVGIAQAGIVLEAKLDTGATTSSLSATKIELFEKDDEQWVRFQLAIEDAPDKTFELPTVRSSRVKRRAEDYDPEDEKSYVKRPVVEMDVSLGDSTETIEVNLADRSRFKYPFLLGASAMKQFKVVVDPSESFTAKKPKISDDDQSA
ncbi:MAG TPA: ATP-dependent zinc protease [Burkholderiaceae bacterium]|nr:ATP-dependent zinc protease [Burkholderiaceae bacterium]